MEVSRLSTMVKLVVVCLLLATACGQEPGTFSMSFTWDQPPPGTVWVWLRVEERTKAMQSGSILASAGPGEYSHGQSLKIQLTDVPNGDDRYVIAEVREGPNSSLPIIYQGISSAFSIRPGRQTHVDVAMVLQTPEAILMKAEVELLFEGAPVTVVDALQIHAATVRLRSQGAVGALLANDAAFSGNLHTWTFADDDGISCVDEEHGTETWTTCLVSPWDLTADMPELGDTTYTLFARFVDRHGYESPVYKASVALDSLGPLVLVASMVPVVVRPGDEVVLTATFHEPLSDSKDSTLAADPPLPPGTMVEGPVPAAGFANYEWTITLPGDAPCSEGTTFTVTPVDALGNGSATTQLIDSSGAALKLAVDSKPPEIVEPSGVTLSQDHFALADAGTALAFDFVVEEAYPVEVNSSFGACMGACPEVRIGGLALGSLLRVPEADEPGAGHLGFRFAYLVNPADFGPVEDQLLLTICWLDEAGNVMETVLPQSVQVDFLRPYCFTEQMQPESGNSSTTFHYSVTTSELLSAAPFLSVESGAEGLFGDPPVESEDHRTFSWSQSAAGMPTQSFTLAVMLEDESGNLSDDGAGNPLVCSVIGYVDGEAPLVTASQVTTEPAVMDSAGNLVLAVRDGSTIRAVFSVQELSGMAEGSPEVVLNVAGEPLEFTQKGEPVEDEGVWAYEFELVMEASAHPQAEGIWPVRTTLLDKSLNLTVEDPLAGALVRVDFTAPSAACSLLPAAGDVPYGLGDALQIYVTPSEPLAADTQPLLIEEQVPSLAVPLFAYDEGTDYRFTHLVVPADGEMTWSVRVHMTDLAGNATAVDETACLDGLLEGSIDGESPEVMDLVLSLPEEDLDPLVHPLRKGLKLDAEVHVKGNSMLPTVKLGAGMMTPLNEAPAVQAEGILVWTYERQLDGTEGEGAVPIMVMGEDLAGNVFEYIHEIKPVLDFTPPTAQCKASQELAGLGDQLSIAVTPSEPTAETPVLVAIPPFELVQEGEGSQYVWTHVVGHDDAEYTSWEYSVSLVDLAGNPSEGMAACSGGGPLDAIAPTIGDSVLSVTPTVVDAAGQPVIAVRDQGIVTAYFTVVEAQGLEAGDVLVQFDTPNSAFTFPEVTLTPGDEGLHECEASATLTAVEHAGLEGSWPMRVQVTDKAGNSTIVEGYGGVPVRVDFTPPEAECSLLPAVEDGLYGSGLDASLLVSPYETLQVGSVPDLVEMCEPPRVDPLFSLVPDTAYRFDMNVSPDSGEHDITLAVRLTDQVGNVTPEGATACTNGVIEGVVDGLAPVVGEVTIEVEDGTIDPVQAPLRAGLTVVAMVTVQGSDIVPSVMLGNGIMEWTQEPPEALPDGSLAWRFLRILTGDEGDGLQIVSVSGADAAGNQYVFNAADQILTLDFKPPSVSCSVLPKQARLGDLITLTVGISEPLLGGPPVPQTDLTWSDTSANEEGTLFSFQHMVKADEGFQEWSYTLVASDLAGNPTAEVPACSGSYTLDGALPVITDGFLVTAPVVRNQEGDIVVAVGDKDQLIATFSLHEEGKLVQTPSVALELGADLLLPLSLVDFQTVDESTTEWTYGLALDALEHLFAEGVWPVRVQATDLAGNTTTVNNLAGLVQVDFTPPKASCLLVPGQEQYALDQSVALFVLPTESLEFEASPVVDQESTWGAPFFVFDQGTSWRYSGMVSEDHDSHSVEVLVSLRDVVGNETGPGNTACSKGALHLTFDTQPVSIGEGTVSSAYLDPDDGVTWVDTGEYAHNGSRVTVSFEVGEEVLAENVLVTVGSSQAQDVSVDETSVVAQVTIDNPGAIGTQVAPVIVLVSDVTGNVSATSFGQVILDFDAPELNGNALIERCDNYPQAHLSATQVAVREPPYECSYTGSEAPDCPEAVQGAVRLKLTASESLQFDRCQVDAVGEGAAVWSIDPCAEGAAMLAVYQPNGEEEQGWAPVTVRLEDRAGNRYEVDVGELLFDYVPPDPPEVSTPGRVVFTRIPWGADSEGASEGFHDTDGESAFALHGLAGATEAGATVTVYDGSDMDGATIIGAGIADQAGAFGSAELGDEALWLEDFDRVHVWVSTTDQAGNEGATALVRDISLVVSMNDKVAGSTNENPHRFEFNTWFENMLASSIAAEVGESAGVARSGGDILVTTAADLTWTTTGIFDTAFSPRHRSVAAYDAARGRTVLFGGTDAEGELLSDTWEWNGLYWTLQVPDDEEEDDNPPALSGSALSYHTQQGEALLFGGLGTEGVTHQMWLWNGSRWLSVEPGDGNLPPARMLHSMAYDSHRTRIVLFGGTDESESEFTLASTWEWDGELWLEIPCSEPGACPSPRSGAAMVFDRSRARTVLFGGMTESGLSNETWEWDGVSWSLVVVDSGPDPRSYHGLSFDGEDNSVLLTGGIGQDGSSLADFWRFNGEGWIPVDVEDGMLDGSPAPRHGHVVAYDANRGKHIMAGGLGNDADMLGDTWLMSGDDWTYAAPQSALSSTVSSAYSFPTFDRQRNRIVNLSGHGGDDTITREWSGRGWFEVEVTDVEGDGDPPINSTTRGARGFGEGLNGGEVFFITLEMHEVAYYTTIFDNNPLWMFDGMRWWRPNLDTGIWPVRMRMAGAYDVDRARLVVFGGWSDDGNNLSDTWELHSVEGGTSPFSWQKIIPADPESDGNPVARRFGSMVYDRYSKRNVLFGGSNGELYTNPEVYDDTWEWNGNSWKRIGLSDPEGDGNPTPRIKATMVCHEVRESIIMLGGTVSDTWELSSGSWRQLTTIDLEGDGLVHDGDKTIYDNFRNLLVSGAGNTKTGRTAENQRPAHLLGLSPHAYGTCSAISLTKVAINWVTGATGGAGPPGADGVELMVWDEGRWFQVATNQASALAPQSLTWTTEDPLQLVRLRGGLEQYISFAVVPQHPNSTGRGQISTDYAELVVHYRIAADDSDQCEGAGP
jgi:hypothetical protein